MSRLFETYCSECDRETVHDAHMTGIHCEDCERARFERMTENGGNTE